MGIKIVSVGTALPKLKVTNDDLSKFLDTNDEWIVSRTGISTRHIISGDESCSTLASEAAKIALERSGLDKNDIEVVVCGNYTPDSATPSVASNVRLALDIGGSCPAFDLNVACSGFIYSLTVAESLMKTMGYKNALVIGVDVNSQAVDWSDRGTAILFGDGAGAVVLSHSEDKGILSTFLSSENDVDKSLYQKRKIDSSPFSETPDEQDVKLHMNGQKVMKFAVGAFIEAVEKVLKDANLTTDDIKMIVPHQANARIVKSAAKYLKLDEGKFYLNMDRVANTSAGSIPIALEEVVEKGLIKKGDKVVFVAFGAGLSSGAVLLEW